MADHHMPTSNEGVDTAPSEHTPSLDRRTMLMGFAVAGAAIPLLAACGGSDSSGDKAGSTTGSTTPTGGGGTTPAGGGGTTTTTGAEEVLAKASQVPVGGGIILADQAIVITQPTKGTFEGFSAICTHLQCTVASISGGIIHCPCHGSMYSIKDGSVQGGPAPAPLPPKPVKDEGGNIVPA
jgi:Rieske Fe-S protein